MAIVSAALTTVLPLLRPLLQVRDTLRALPNHYVTGIVSGRSLAKIRNFVGVPGLFYAGSHGFDILAPSSKCTAECGALHHSVHCTSVDKELPVTEAPVHSSAELDCSPPAPPLRKLISSHSIEDITGVIKSGLSGSVSSNALSSQDCNSERGSSQRSHSVSNLNGNDEVDGVRYQVAGEFLPALQQIRRELEEVSTVTTAMLIT
jgi:Trehalose-phosphatase